jgi:hypothetical protein
MEPRDCTKDFELKKARNGNRGELELWGAVLLQAVEDLRRRGPSFEIAMNGIRLKGRTHSARVRRDRNNAAAWFRSSSNRVGSFLWICDLFGLDADVVRTGVKKKVFKRVNGTI